MEQADFLNLRLYKLERRNKTLGWLFALLATLCLTTAFWLTRRTTIVRELKLVDISGRGLLTLGSDGSKTCLEMQGQTKIAAVRLCASDTGGADLEMYDERNGNRVVLSAGGKRLGIPGQAELKVSEKDDHYGSSSSGLFVEDEKSQRVLDVTVGDDASLFVGRMSKKDSLQLSTLENHPQVIVLRGDANMADARE